MSRLKLGREVEGIARHHTSGIELIGVAGILAVDQQFGRNVHGENARWRFKHRHLARECNLWDNVNPAGIGDRFGIAKRVRVAARAIPIVATITGRSAGLKSSWASLIATGLYKITVFGPT